MNRSTWRNLGVVLAGLAAWTAVATLSNDRARAQASATAGRVPVFEVDPAWPKLPNNWVVGHVASVAVDRRDHVWMLHRPNTIPEDRRKNGAPPVLEFDAAGKFVNAWGGPGSGYDWPDSEHGIAVDYRDRVWIGGSAPVAPSLRNLDDDMQFVDEWRHFGRPSGIAILKDDTLIVADSESSQFIGGPPQAPEGGGNVVRNPGWGNGIRIGSAKDGSLRYYVQGTRPEGMGADNEGNVFAGLTGGCDASPSGGCLQKWVKK